MIAKTIKSSISVNAPRRVDEVLHVRVMEVLDAKITVPTMGAAPMRAQAQTVMSDDYK
jgi:hypothetical protein